MAQDRLRDQGIVAEAFQKLVDEMHSLSLDPTTFESNPKRFFIAGTFDGEQSIYPNGWKYIKDGFAVGAHYERIYFRPELTDPSSPDYEDLPVMINEVSRVEMKRTKNGYDPYFISTKLESDGDLVRVYFLDGGEEALVREIISPSQGHTVGWVYSPDHQITAYTFGRDAELDFYSYLDDIDPGLIKKYPFGRTISVDLLGRGVHTISTLAIDHPLTEKTSTSIVRINGGDYLQFDENRKQVPEGKNVTAEEALLLPRRQFTLARVPMIRPQSDSEFPESMKSLLFKPHFLRNPIGVQLREDAKWNTLNLAVLTGIRELFN